jgi:hypothetical protein
MPWQITRVLLSTKTAGEGAAAAAAAKPRAWRRREAADPSSCDARREEEAAMAGAVLAAAPALRFFPPFSPNSIRFVSGFWDGAPRLPLSSVSSSGVSRSILAGKVERPNFALDPCNVDISKAMDVLLYYSNFSIISRTRECSTVFFFENITFSIFLWSKIFMKYR